VFDQSIVDDAAREKEVELTTYGRKTGRPSRRIVWISVIDRRLYVRSGLGLGRDWPQNLIANGRGVLHIAGRDVPVRARHVTDPAEARAMHPAVKAKYNAERPASRDGEPLTPAEQAVFELVPAER
jgi:deazaflavin-dependent oxidoreductase (nitroreductase family)